MTAPRPAACGRTAFDGPCDDPSCGCHAEFWDAAAIAAARTPLPIDVTEPEAVRGRYRVPQEVANFADAMVSLRASRVARAKAAALEARARIDHPSPAWED